MKKRRRNFRIFNFKLRRTQIDYRPSMNEL